ncbi:putative ribosomal RNA processing protein [Leptomonas pyrrhocoris]|uniref:Putative ribosomal RNA processing protein n=1 Tax=Leptomonas pyrrhocoris TaxID=157538 RepID=A0A0M9FS78_LEPPY|nr:putative ribosomal RNA processing protein [Leptomonas pyrrhocoris]KPA74917.1 putative ribosomal RNA processing protein [Leptomonas pyrrhocoris]|eukprot:XP_015653356.1 putative ribosomal RNA processing protein [Leptomonas pyrrhocoris]
MSATLAGAPPFPSSSTCIGANPVHSSTSVVYARRDGRTALEMRGKEMKLSEMVAFDGSSWYAQGQTAVTVSLHGPTLAKSEVYDTCLVRVRVQHARGRTPAAGGAERAVFEEVKLELLTRRDAMELASLLESTIDAVFMRERFPRCVLVVDVVVMQDDGSLPAVALNATMCALLDAGLPCRTTMAAVSVVALSRAQHSSRHDGKGGGAAPASPSWLSSSTVGAGGTSGATAGADVAGSAVEFLLDPTRVEETLSSGDDNTAVVRVEKDDISGSSSSASAPAVGGGSRLSLPGKDAAQALQEQYSCVSTGVFVFSNPACGGGLLGQLVRRRCDGDGRDGGSAGAIVSLEAYGQMMALAERAAAVLFEFFRQCNVAE